MVVSQKKRSSAFALFLPFENGVLQKKKEKKVFSQCGCTLPSASLVQGYLVHSLVVWALFFGTVLFLVNENMVPLLQNHFSFKRSTVISTNYFTNILRMKSRKDRPKNLKKLCNGLLEHNMTGF